MTRDVNSALAALIAAGESVVVEFKRSLTKDLGRGVFVYRVGTG